MSDEEIRNLPTSELDLNLMLTNSVWGRADVSQELKERLMKYYIEKDGAGQIITNENGEMMVSKSSLWGLLGFYTRDMRLANLSEWNQELQTCRYMLDLANDYLTENMIEPFIVALSRAANIMETSQSKGGFLRRQMNTLTQKNVNQNLEPPKKGFFGGSKKNEGGF